MWHQAQVPKQSDQLVQSKRKKQAINQPNTMQNSINQSRNLDDLYIGHAYSRADLIRYSHNIHGRGLRHGTKPAKCRCLGCGQLLQNFCENTTLHGLKYVGGKGLPRIDRLLWLVAFILALLTAGFFISQVYKKWDVTPVIVTIGTRKTRVDEIPFPAITLCPSQLLQKKVGKQLQKPKTEEDNLIKQAFRYFVDEEYDGLYPVLNTTHTWEIIFKFLKRVTKPCKKIIRTCVIRTLDCSTLFTPIIINKGICCSFNNVKRSFSYRNSFDPFHANDSIHKAAVDWHPDRGYPPGTPPEALPYRILKGTPFAGVNILINSFDDVAYGNYIDVDLFIMIHSPLETPNMKIPASLRIERQQYYNIKITPSVTVSEKSLTSLDIKRRQCFFSSDKYLKFFKSYTQKNCFTECLINATLRECGCVPYYLRIDYETTMCDKSKIKCVEGIQDPLYQGYGNHRQIELGCNCLPNCNDVVYSSSLVSSHYYNRDKSGINLFFENTEYLNYYKTELYGLSDFLANTGGLLGLFLGFSFLSVVEIAYYATLRTFRFIFQRRQITTNTTKH